MFSWERERNRENETHSNSGNCSIVSYFRFAIPVFFFAPIFVFYIYGAVLFACVRQWIFDAFDIRAGFWNVRCCVENIENVTQKVSTSLSHCAVNLALGILMVSDIWMNCCRFSCISLWVKRNRAAARKIDRDRERASENVSFVVEFVQVRWENQCYAQHFAKFVCDIEQAYEMYTVFHVLNFCPRREAHTQPPRRREKKTLHMLYGTLKWIIYKLVERPQSKISRRTVVMFSSPSSYIFFPFFYSVPSCSYWILSARVCFCVLL